MHENKAKPMKILITGAGGFVGKKLTYYLAENGHRVIAAVHSTPPIKDKRHFSSPNVDILELDLTSLDCGQLPSDINVIYTLAQSVNFREFPEKAEDVFAVNIAANFKLWQWAVQSGVRKCIHISSGGIYGGEYRKVFHENELLAIGSPLGFYLSSKLCSEIIFLNYNEFFETTIILRPFFIYGPGQRRDMFISRLIELVKKGQSLQLQGKQGLRVNPVYVDDAVIAFANASNLNGFHIINVAGPDVLNLRQVGETIGQALGKKPVFEMLDETPVDYIANTEQAARKLNQPMTSFTKGIIWTIAGNET